MSKEGRQCGIPELKQQCLAYVCVGFDKGVDHLLTYRHLPTGNEQKMYHQFLSLSLEADSVAP